MNLTNALERIEKGWVFTDVPGGYSLRKFTPSLKEFVDAKVGTVTARALLKRGVKPVVLPRVYELYGAVAA